MPALLQHLQAAPVAIWTVDRNLVFTSVGGGLFTMVPFPVPAVPGGKLTDFLGIGQPRRTGMASLNSHLAALRGEVSQSRVGMRRGASMLTCWPLREDGAVVGALGMIVPLEERYAAEFGDADAKDWFSQIMDHSPAAVLVRDRHRKLVWASPAYSRQIGLSLEQLVGSGLDDVFPAEVASTMGEVYDQVLDRDKPSSALVEAGGQHVDMVVFPMQARTGEALLGTVAVDVTERVQAELGHRAAEQRFEEFMSYCPAGAYLKDSAGRFVWTNRAFLDAYGLTEEDVTGRTFAEALPGAGSADEVSLDERVLRGGEPAVSTGTSVRRDGTAVHQVGYRFPVVAADGERLLGGIFLDNSAAVSAREDARRATSRHQRFFDRHPAPMLLVDEWGVIRDANPALCGLLRRRLSALRTLRLAEVASAPDEHGDPAALLAAGPDGARRELVFAMPEGHPALRCAVSGIRIDDHPVSTLLVLDDVEPDRSGVISLSRAECDVLEWRAAGKTAAAAGTSPHSATYVARKLAQRLGWPSSAAAMTARAYVEGVLDVRTWPPRVADAFRAEG
ncbi:PAS domain-containing protein [Actinokineospora guangxiensis]|uniref:PAS domain-containing protein n=1 Tax=Actinokineospora guangxiensis TaxID=1490288 RepID=A0ABW0EW20_9PSEU